VPVLLLGYVQVAEVLVRDNDPDPHEGVHRRVAMRESVGAPVPRDVEEAKRDRVLDQLSKHSAAVRRIADLRARGCLDAEREEAHELASRLVEDADGCVPGAGELTRALEQPPQQLLEVEAEQIAHALPGQPGRKRLIAHPARACLLAASGHASTTSAGKPMKWPCA